MKKQLKKLCLSKKTISNLDPSELNSKIGGQYTQGGLCQSHNGCGGNSKKCTLNCTHNGNSCPGHATC